MDLHTVGVEAETTATVDPTGLETLIVAEYSSWLNTGALEFPETEVTVIVTEALDVRGGMPESEATTVIYKIVETPHQPSAAEAVSIIISSEGS